MALSPILNWGSIYVYFCGYCIYYSASAFADVLITNSLYILLGESYHSQISIGPEYNLFYYWLLSELQRMLQMKCPTWVIFFNIVWEILKVHTMFPRTWWIRSNTALEMGFPEVLGLSLILYYVSIRGVLNLIPINYDPWLYVNSIGIGYIYSHVVLIKYVIDIALFYHIVLFKTILKQDRSS